MRKLKVEMYRDKFYHMAVNVAAVVVHFRLTETIRLSGNYQARIGILNGFKYQLADYKSK